MTATSGNDSQWWHSFIWVNCRGLWNHPGILPADASCLRNSRQDLMSSIDVGAAWRTCHSHHQGYWGNLPAVETEIPLQADLEVHRLQGRSLDDTIRSLLRWPGRTGISTCRNDHGNRGNTAALSMEDPLSDFPAAQLQLHSPAYCSTFQFLGNSACPCCILVGAKYHAPGPYA